MTAYNELREKIYHFRIKYGKEPDFILYSHEAYQSIQYHFAGKFLIFDNFGIPYKVINMKESMLLLNIELESRPKIANITVD